MPIVRLLMLLSFSHHTSWTFSSKLHVCASFSHECSSSCSKGPHHRSAAPGSEIVYYYNPPSPQNRVQTLKFLFLSCSITGKRQLSTLRRISTIKWRLPVRSSEPALWGEHRNQQPDDTGRFLAFIYFLLFFLLSRFKISKVIVVGDLAVGKTCLINR